MKKILIGILITSLIIGSILIIKNRKTGNKDEIKIGILQTATHPALDASRDGFINRIEKEFGKNIKIVVKNAEGSITVAHTIAQQFFNDKSFNAFFAIATPAAQALTSLEKNRPIFISAVTDPSSIGITEKTKNVSGTKDLIDAHQTVSLLQDLVPNAKKVGILYTSGELNSQKLASMLKYELNLKNISFIEFKIANESDIQAATESACRKCDAIITPTDNLVACGIKLITKITRKNKKPLIVCDNMLVKFGALASQGVNYFSSGQEAAEIAIQVIKEKKSPADIQIKSAGSDTIFFNKNVLNELNIDMPSNIKNFILEEVQC